MAKLEQYRESVQKLLQDYAALSSGDRTLKLNLFLTRLEIIIK